MHTKTFAKCDEDVEMAGDKIRANRERPHARDSYPLPKSGEGKGGTNPLEREMDPRRVDVGDFLNRDRKGVGMPGRCLGRKEDVTNVRRRSDLRPLPTSTNRFVSKDK